MYAVGNVVNFLWETHAGRSLNAREVIRLAFAATHSGMLEGDSIHGILGGSFNTRSIFSGWMEMNVAQLQVGVNAVAGRPSVDLARVLILLWGDDTPSEILKCAEEGDNDAAAKILVQELEKIGIVLPHCTGFYILVPEDATQEAQNDGTAGA